MYTLSKDSIRVRNKYKGKRKRNKKVNSRNSVEESSSEHIGLSTDNSNESFLSESSDVPKKPDNRPSQNKFREKQIFKPSADCFM